MCRIPQWEPTGKKSRRSGVRAFIVALKPGNSGGAKGRREMDGKGKNARTNDRPKCRSRLDWPASPRPCGEGESLRLNGPHVDCSGNQRTRRRLALVKRFLCGVGVLSPGRATLQISQACFRNH